MLKQGFFVFYCTVVLPIKFILGITLHCPWIGDFISSTSTYLVVTFYDALNSVSIESWNTQSVVHVLTQQYDAWLIKVILSFLYHASFQHKKWKTNWCHCFNFIHISTDLYMFRAHLPIFRRIHTAVPTSIGSVSVPFWLCVLYVVEIRR